MQSIALVQLISQLIGLIVQAPVPTRPMDSLCWEQSAVVHRAIQRGSRY